MTLKLITWSLRDWRKRRLDNMKVICNLPLDININNFAKDIEICTHFYMKDKYIKKLEKKYKININIEPLKIMFHYPIIYDSSENIFLKHKINCTYSGEKKNTFCLIFSCEDNEMNYRLVKELITYKYEYYVITSPKIRDIEVYLKKFRVPSEKVIKINSEDVYTFLTESIISLNLITENYNIICGCFSHNISKIMKAIKNIRLSGELYIGRGRFICI